MGSKKLEFWGFTGHDVRGKTHDDAVRQYPGLSELHMGKRRFVSGRPCVKAGTTS